MFDDTKITDEVELENLYDLRNGWAINLALYEGKPVIVIGALERQSVISLEDLVSEYNNKMLDYTPSYNNNPYVYCGIELY